MDVGPFWFKTSEEELRKAFSAFGTITDVNLKHKDTGIVFAFIEFDSTEAAEKAVAEYYLSSHVDGLISPVRLHPDFLSYFDWLI